MAVDPRSPCIIGVAQETFRDGAPEPLDMWERVARAAAADAGVPGAVASADSVQVVYTQSWNYDDPAARLCERLGASPAEAFYSGIGGTTPQVLVNKVAEAILAGTSDLALVVGAEALATRRVLKKAGEKPQWSHKHPDRPEFPVSGGGGQRVTGDPLEFVLAATGRTDPGALGLDETVNVYREQ